MMEYLYDQERRSSNRAFAVMKVTGYKAAYLNVSE